MALDTTKTKTAWVTPEGDEPVEVEVPAHFPDLVACAVVAWRKKCDAWEDMRKVSVTFEKPAASN
jgi:hypothetical protein